jgi:hypothetical protein
MACLDYGSLLWLDDFGAVVRDDFADCRRHHVDAAKDGLQQRDQGKQHNGPCTTL